MAFSAELMDTQTKRNPISTLDDAVMWLAENECDVDFNGSYIAVLWCMDARVSRKIGDGGFDARGTLMMATRELWEMVNK